MHKGNREKFPLKTMAVERLTNTFTNLKKDDDNAHTNYIQSIYKKKLNSPVSPLEDDVNDNHMIKLCSPIMKKKLDSPVSPEPEDVNDIEMINKCHPTDNKKLHNPTSSQPQNVNDIEMINFCDDDDLDISKDSLMAFLSSEDMSLIDSKGSLFSDM
ncbi:hypothetical protein Pcinc_012792 [Petrolisthes cinctipes]|uniref:Uncharacterized protein n=1 Tax=Petrolisthes cinctipes TaxID=88211 RepID=A0AAE1FZV7_PETCI|nr:hypothetical protein Pcinc_012792 [Petrolisthes cinctipes]